MLCLIWQKDNMSFLKEKLECQSLISAAIKSKSNLL